jgi:hypothetical protein
MTSSASKLVSVGLLALPTFYTEGANGLRVASLVFIASFLKPGAFARLLGPNGLDHGGAVDAQPTKVCLKSSCRYVCARLAR